MNRRNIMLLLVPGLTTLAGCGPQAERHAAALTMGGSVSAARARQTRRFDTGDQVLLLQSSAGVLQDLGYTIVESQPGFGVIVGTKAIPRPIRVQIVVRPEASGRSSLARATFQVAVPGPIGQENLDDPLLYQQFFDKLSQSVFLTAHEI